MKMLSGPKASAPAAKVDAPTQIRVPQATDPKVKAAARVRQRRDEDERQGRGSTNLSRVYSRTRLG